MPLSRHLVGDLCHVHRNANRATLVGDGARDRLPDPPDRVGRHLDVAAIVELLDCAHEAEIAFLDQIEEVQGGLAGIGLAIELTRRKCALIIASRADLSSRCALPISPAAARNSAAGKPTHCSTADNALRKAAARSGLRRAGVLLP